MPKLIVWSSTSVDVERSLAATFHGWGRDLRVYDQTRQVSNRGHRGEWTFDFHADMKGVLMLEGALSFFNYEHELRGRESVSDLTKVFDGKKVVVLSGPNTDGTVWVGKQGVAVAHAELLPTGIAVYTVKFDDGSEAVGLLSGELKFAEE